MPQEISGYGSKKQTPLLRQFVDGLNIFEYPFYFRCRIVRRKMQSCTFANHVPPLCPLPAYVCSPWVVVTYCIVNRFSGLFVPHHDGCMLSGDAKRCYLLFFRPDFPEK